MFWGLIMEPNKRYTQTVETSFHVSMASLDISNASSDETVQVMLCYENRNYLLCNLKKGSILHSPLDLNFQQGSKIAFVCNGKSHVHLTGYLIPEDELDLDDLEEEEVEAVLQSKQGKRKTTNMKDSRVTKIAKTDFVEEEKVDKDEDDEDEDDEDDDDDEDDIDCDTPTDDSDVEESEEDNIEDEEESEDDDESDVEKVVQPLPQKKQKKKQEKQKMVNGNVSLPEKKQKKQKEQKNTQLQNDYNKIVADHKKNKGEQKQNDQAQSVKKTIEGGVQIEDLKIGNGAPAKPGKFVSVYFVGRLKNGKKFDSTTQGDGFKFRLGKGEVIKGWDIGIAGMKVGGKRRIVIPSNLAYGAKGCLPVIPGNSILHFEVELKNVH